MLSNNAIKEFQTLYKQEFGIDLPIEEAGILATKVYLFFYAIVKPD